MKAELTCCGPSCERAVREVEVDSLLEKLRLLTSTVVYCSDRCRQMHERELAVLHEFMGIVDNFNEYELAVLKAELNTPMPIKSLDLFNAFEELEVSSRERFRFLERIKKEGARLCAANRRARLNELYPNKSAPWWWNEIKDVFARLNR